MAMDELRRRLRAEMGRRRLNPNAVSDRAQLRGPVLYEFMKQPGKTLEPETLRKLAAYFDWPVVEVFRWAEFLPPADSNPLADLHGALWQGPWEEEDARALYRLAQRTVQAAPDVGPPPPLRIHVERAADLALRPWAASEGTLSASEVRSIITGDFLVYLQEAMAGAGAS